MELVINDRIRNRRVVEFTKVAITLKYDAVASVFNLSYYFDPNNTEHKELSCVGHYHIAKITHNGHTLLTGYVLSITFAHAAERELCTIGGYSLPGVLEDCEIPIAIPNMNLQNSGYSLKEIATRYLKPFGIGLVVDGSVVQAAGNNILDFTPDQSGATSPDNNAYTLDTTKTVEDIMIPTTTPWQAPSNTPQSQAAFNSTPEGQTDKYGIYITPWGNDSLSVNEKMDQQFLETTAQVGRNIKEYLARLASYKNITLSHDANGNLVFTRAKTSKRAKATFTLGVPATSMSLSFNGQQMHSHITCVQQPDVTGTGEVYMSTLRNPYVPYVFRPKTVVVSSPDGTDYTLLSCKNLLANELRNLKLIITTDRWTFADGTIIRPNHIINVINPEIYLYKQSRWFIEEVTLEGDNVKQIAKLVCVVPEVYNYVQPGYLFRGINLH